MQAATGVENGGINRGRANSSEHQTKRVRKGSISGRLR
jgi:hypothetical protein